MKTWDKTILTVLLQWDYGVPARGPSLEKTCFHHNLVRLVTRVESFWIDEYLDRLPELQDLVLNKARDIAPDLIVFIPYTDQFSLRTLDTLKRLYTTYAWFGDDQWRFDSFTSRYAPHYTHVSTTSPWSIPAYRRIGVVPIMTQWAAQPYSGDIGPLVGDGAYEHDISFVGGANAYRRWFIKKMKHRGINVACFGSGWENGRVSYEQMEQIFRKSRINLNISNSTGQDVRFVLGGPRCALQYLSSRKRAEQIKARNFEIPLAGGFQLTNYVPGLERYLAIGEEVAAYSTPEECAQQIAFYLEQEEARTSIAERGHHRAVAEHTYAHRLEQILEHIWG